MSFYSFKITSADAPEPRLATGRTTSKQPKIFFYIFHAKFESILLLNLDFVVEWVFPQTTWPLFSFMIRTGLLHPHCSFFKRPRKKGFVD